ncbi:MAG: glycerol-3-phosphate dehydrogenase [Blastocatellia bacterium]|nr:glycerol-3-phosphate dehydrogenase [Blastocatellia bacterium]
MKSVAIMGAGSWGTALAVMAGRAGHEVRLWSRNAEVVASVNARHVNDFYLASCLIPDKVRATTVVGEVLVGAELVILAAPSHATRDLLRKMLPALHAEMILISASKGIENESGMRISEIVIDELGKIFPPRFVCLSGPSFASEVVAGHPTAIVAAGVSESDSAVVQQEFSFDNLRIYRNRDVVGTEIGGAVKNVMAIAAGMVAGLGFGSNSVAALITRGLAEMTRFALAQGARIETLMGLAGLGDLVLTCTGSLSRNRFVGEELGKGRALGDILSDMREVAEGVRTTHSVKQLSARLGIEMPVVNEIHRVLYEGKPAMEAARDLMARPLRGEPD